MTGTGSGRPPARGPVAVTGLGIVTAVGATAEQTLTSILAGVRRVSERPLAGAGGDPGEEGGVYLASGAEGLAAALGGSEPLDLALAAARESFWDAGLYEPRDVETAYRRSAVCVFLALPYADAPGADPGAPTAFLDAAVAARLLERDRATVVAVRSGHAGGVLALAAATSRLASGEIDVALVGGQDAMLDPAAVAEMNRRSKLRTDRAPGGATPGEGSAFVVLERLDEAKRRRARPYAVVEAVHQDREAIPFDGPQPNQGEGATRAVNGALATAPSATRVRDVFTDLNGERGRSLEWALVETRCFPALPAGWRRHVPASVVGDLGAASGGLLIAMAARTVGKGKGSGGAAMVCSAAERGERAVAVLGPVPAGGKE